MATKVIMPQLGESVVEGTVTKWLVKEGDPIKEFDAILEVNTDKVDTEIPSPAAGTLLKLVIPEGTTVQAGTVLAWIGEPGEALPAEAGAARTEPDKPPSTAAQKPESVTTAPPSSAAEPARERGGAGGFISPVVARLAGERSVDLSQVKGTGSGGRITKQDVLEFLEQKARPTPEIELAPWETPGEGDLFRPTEMMFPGGQEAVQPASAKPAAAPPPAGGESAGNVVSLSPMRRAIAEHMVQSSRTSPHVTTVMEADMAAAAAHRQANQAAFSRDGANLTYSAYFVAAVVSALKAFPLVNSSWSDEGIRLHPGINIGMATSLGEEGLIVPVIKSTDSLSLLGIARAVNDLAERARSRRLQPDEVKGGTFTITNHGTGGSLFATPIINQPQCAILGVGLIQKRAVVINDAIAIRPMVYLSLSFDHRILDGAQADGFLAKVVDTLQKWV